MHTLNEREQAHADAVKRINELYRYLVSGIIMLKEFTAAVAELHGSLPDLQVGDIEYITGLRVK